MVPAAALLATSQIVRSGEGIDEAIRSTVAGVGAMVPEGLVLLTSVAFALGAVRLARRRVLVQELAAIEGLARVDVLCIDKTGTLTEAAMALHQVVPLSEHPVSDVLATIAGSDPAPNATMLAVRTLPAPVGWEVTQSTPFSSARKWSAAQIRGRGSWVLGAPDVLIPELDARVRHEVESLARDGYRVLLLARAEGDPVGEQLPPGLTPAALVVLGERLRPEASATIDYLVGQGVTVKVLSGDAPATVASVARRVGIPAAGEAVDARGLADGGPRLMAQVENSSVFGRVQPQQKRAIVEALQAKGHVVAMTGDGVNDIPAVKIADLGMAMGSGSAATRAVARVVLLDNSFGVVPLILAEGRRVIANIQRVANLFVTKTVYAALLAVVVGIFAIPYPFFPRHLTIVSSLTIGIPGFFLAFAPGAPRARSGFVGRVLRFTVPAGTVAASVTMLAYLIARGPAHATMEQARTAATLALLLIGLAVLALVSRPLTRARAALVAAMALAAVPLWFVPVSRSIFGLDQPPPLALLGVLVAVALGVTALALVTPGRPGRRAVEGPGRPMGRDRDL